MVSHSEAPRETLRVHHSRRNTKRLKDRVLGHSLFHELSVLLWEELQLSSANAKLRPRVTQ